MKEDKDLLSAFIEISKKYPQKIALTYLRDQKFDECLTYEQLQKNAIAIAIQLQKTLPKQSKVMLVFPLGLELVTAILGCFYAGVVAVPIFLEKWNSSSAEQKKLLEQINPAGAVISNDCLVESFTALPVFCVSQIYYNQTEAWANPELALNDGLYLQVHAPEVKCKLLTVQEILEHVANLSTKINFSNTDIVVGEMPENNVLGLMDGILLSLFAGATSYLLPTGTLATDPFVWLATISRKRATVSLATADVYESAMNGISNNQKARLDLGSWNSLIYFNEPSRVSLLQEFKDYFRDCNLKSQALVVKDLIASKNVFEVISKDKTNKTQLYTREELIEKIKLIISDVLEVSNEYLKLEVSLVHYGLASLQPFFLVNAIQKLTEIKVPLEIFYQDITINGLVDYLLIKMEEGFDATTPASKMTEIVAKPAKRFEPFELNDVQKAYLIGRQDDFKLGGVGCHYYVELETDSLEITKFTNAWQRLIQRHEMLRVVFEDGKQKVLAKTAEFKIIMHDLQGLSEIELEEQLVSLRKEFSHKVFNPEQWPLFMVNLALLPDGKTRICLNLDLLILDWYSITLLSEDLKKIYDNLDVVLDEMMYSYRDLVLAENLINSEERNLESYNYWRKRLPELPAAPELTLAKDFTKLRKPFFERKKHLIPLMLWKKFKEKAGANRITPSAMLLSAFGEVLARFSQNSKFTLTMTIFGRNLLENSANLILGDFTNVAYIEIDKSIGQSFAESSLKVHHEINTALKYKVGAIKAMRELGSKLQNNLFPVVFTSALGVVNGIGKPFTWLGEEVYGITQTPQVYLDHQVLETTEGVLLIWDYIAELFPDGMIEEMYGAYLSLLEQFVVADFVWENSVSLRLSPEYLALRKEVNTTATEVPDELLHELFLKQVSLQPDAPAVFCKAGMTTYAELDRMSSLIAQRLIKLKVQPNTLVAVGLRKGWLQVAAVLGVLKSGAAYLPLDPALPFERRQTILDQALAEIVLLDTELQSEIVWPENKLCIAVDQLKDSLEKEFIMLKQSPDDLAYVIFTSGSTGTPKGVMISHRGAVNTILDLNERFQMNPHDRAFALSALNFDLSVYDIFGILACGGAIVMPDPSLRREPGHWHDLVHQYQVTLWNSVPALMEMYTEFCLGRELALPQSLRLIWMSGDWIPITLPGRIRSLKADLDLISMGGATEASIWSIIYPINEVDPDWKSIPYGKPMLNQTFYVYDHAFNEAPVWVPGRLYIGGIGVALGYWNDPVRTGERFVVHPVTGERLYWTGDLGRYLPDGNIEFLGREDFQVKIRGYRIELEEIEAVLLQHAEIKSAAVNVHQTKAGMQRLVAYLVSSNGVEVATSELQAFASAKLPDYMVPALWIFLPNLPLSANGKIDRKALPDPLGLNQVLPAKLAKIDDGIVQRLVEICQGLLQNNLITGQSNFFELGGDSLLATNFTSEIERNFGVRIKLGNIFERPVLDDLADLIKASQAELGIAVNEVAQTTELIHDEIAHYEPFPLSDVQYAYWVGRSKMFELGNAACQGYMEFEVTQFDPQRFELAWQKVIARHDMLRAVVLPDGKQVIEKDFSFELPMVDLSMKSEVEQKVVLAEIRNERSHLVLPTNQAPLFVVSVTKLSEAKWYIHLNVDLLVMDFWSYLLLEQELKKYYFQPELEPEAFSLTFRDFMISRAGRETTTAYQEAWQYWERRLPTLFPAPKLPLMKELSKVIKPSTERYLTELDSEDWQKLRQQAKLHGITPTVVVLTAFADVIKYWSSNEQFTLNLTMFDREGDHPDLNQIIGDFTTVNLLSFDYVNAGGTFIDRAKRNQQQLWEDLSYKEVGGVRVLRELSKQYGNSFKAIMPIVFTSTLSSNGFEREPAFSWLGKQTYMACQTPQVYFDHQVTEDTQGLHCSWDIVEELFPEGMIAMMQAVFQGYLLKLALRPEAWTEAKLQLEPANLGKTFTQAELMVVDEAGRSCPEWATGRLVLMGETLKAASSLRLATENTQIIKTALKARRLPDGSLELLGFEQANPLSVAGVENQKLMLQTILEKHPAVQRVNVMPHQDQFRALVCLKEKLKSDTSKQMVNDPTERLAFKLAKPGLRQEEFASSIRLDDSNEEDMLERFLERRSYRSFKATPVASEALGRLLGRLRHRKITGYPLTKELYSSAGGLYPVQAYLYLKPNQVADLAGGIYYYHPVEHTLKCLNVAANMPAELFQGANISIFNSAAFAIFLIADLEAIEPIYGDYAESFCLMEAGIISHLLESAATTEELGLCQIGALQFERIANLFKLKTSHKYLHCLLGGAINATDMTEAALIKESAPLVSMIELLKQTAATAEKVEPARSTKVTLSKTERQAKFAEIRAWLVKEAGELAAVCELEEWQETAPPLKLEPQVKPNLVNKSIKVVENGTTQILSEIFSELLEVADANPAMNFFDLGGNSLLAVQAANLVRQNLQVELSVLDIFEHPTINSLSEFINELTLEQPVAKAVNQEESNLSEQRERMKDRMQRLKAGRG